MTFMNMIDEIDKSTVLPVSVANRSMPPARSLMFQFIFKIEEFYIYACKYLYHHYISMYAYLCCRTLPDRFPLQAPCIQVMAGVKHAWLNANGIIIGHPELRAWNVHADLGKIVTDIVLEFQRNIPQWTSTTYETPPPPPNNAHHNNAISPEIRIKTMTMPRIPAIFPELEELSTAQLEKLVNDKDARSTVVQKTSSVLTSLKVCNEVQENNKQNAGKPN